MLESISLTREKAGIVVSCACIGMLFVVFVLMFFFPEYKPDPALLATLTTLAASGFGFVTGKQTSQPTQEQTDTIAKQAAKTAAEEVRATNGNS